MLSVRAHIIAIAESWIGTPYHPMGRVKGAGVDCLTLLAEVYAEAGVIDPVALPYYPQDWHLHRGDERYLEGLLRYGREIEGPPQPGDIALWKFGRCYSHGAIVVDWPQIIHAYTGSACIREDAHASLWLRSQDGEPRPCRVFSVV